MSRNKFSSKQSEPTTRYGRQIVYDREIFISICARLLRGEDLDTICATLPMPIGPVFLGWVEDHSEARAIYRSTHNFRSDRELAKKLAVFPARVNVAEWEEQVRANCERGWPADWIERKYVPPDWNKVYPLLGDPPVWSTENMEAYNELLNDFTQMLEPRDMMELMSTKEAADASWEVARIAREKNGVPERKCQQRLKVLAELERRRTRAAETTAVKPATAHDHSLGLEAGFKYYQALDIAQSRAIKRRDNALRQIARWRDGLGAKARRLSDKLVAEQALAESYCANQFLAYAEIDDPMGEEAVPPPAPVGDAADIAPAVPTLEKTPADIAPAVPPSGEGKEAVFPLAPVGDAPDIAPPIPPSDETAADIAPAVPPADEGAEAAPPRAPADDEPISWVAWLTGAEKYTRIALSKGAQKDFKQPLASKKWLVQHLVVDRKVIRPDQVCPELAQYLPAIAEAARTVVASSEAPK